MLIPKIDSSIALSHYKISYMDKTLFLTPPCLSLLFHIIFRQYQYTKHQFLPELGILPPNPFILTSNHHPTPIKPKQSPNQQQKRTDV